ncbi:hypothetical protein AJ80_04299 [Polytolypa hystricis UAMH7299]|uniref:BZIP domain-containing protein n=1 Tax=Polytolypa hystricis (strain UAMH7299) TaxID=1447883 RepID=A0A2B7YCU2_POLH7|nr:hypothetical protein AJ80_04299 [Polytolypa hystricis UAMH7299]
MGSVSDGAQLLRDGTALEDVVPKSEPNPEGSCSSSVSTPEPDGETAAQDPTQRQKRKGGRKPIYATSEERKQRNRQAQAAFRERRTEYIKQLENTIKHNEETLQTLQQSHRSAADECLMLRYKNSLLERILLEKGIDVQAELSLKSGSPGLNPSKPSTQSASHASPRSRGGISKQPIHRHRAGLAPKPDPLHVTQAHREDAYTTRSPQLQPTPTSHVSSPSTAKSPGFALQGGMSPTGTDIHAQQQQQQRNAPQSHSRPQLLPHPGTYSHTPQSIVTQHSDAMDATPATQPMIPSSNTMNASRMPPAYYPSPFQKHYDQLGKRTRPSPPTPLHQWSSEYDAQADMIDEPDADEAVEATPYSEFHEQAPSRGGGGSGNGSGNGGGGERRTDHQRQTSHSQPGEQDTLGESASSFFDHFDPMLDADPFGLTASMHFQTPFSYSQNPARQ